jgi:hypothetical protein
VLGSSLNSKIIMRVLVVKYFTIKELSILVLWKTFRFKDCQYWCCFKTSKTDNFHERTDKESTVL